MNLERLVHRQRGVGLIEVMISVLILSLGFLAAAQMQVQGMRFSQSAYHRSQAYFLASDMLDRMRANVRGVSDGVYEDMSTSAGLNDPGCAQASATCSPAKIAQQDRFDWSQQLHPGNGAVPALPGNAVGKVERVVGSEDLYTVTLTWSEIIDGEDASESLSVTFVAER